MTKSEIVFVNYQGIKESVLEVLGNIPQKLIDASPSDLKQYFKSKYQGITDNEADTLTALHLVKTLQGNEPLKDSMKALSMIKHRIKNIYSELGNSPDHPLWPFIEIAAIAVTRNKSVIVF